MRCRGRLVNTWLTASRPGSPWIGRASTSSDAIIAASPPSGSASQSRALAVQPDLVRANSLWAALAPLESEVRPASARQRVISKNTAR